jgi:hypothetical protein
MSWPSVPAAVVVFHLLVILLIGWRLARRAGRPSTAPVLDVDDRCAGASTSTVSVLVPMRNEADNVGRCLAAVSALRGRVVDVIVVDDHSEDETFELASRFARQDDRVRIIRGRDIPEAWVAKNFALQQGSEQARGAWLLFIDADVVVHGDALVRAVPYAEARGIDLLSLSPRQECGGFWERAIQPLVFAMLASRYDMEAINDPATPVAAANGQFILIRRAVYDALGGHAAVKDQVLEDVALAALLKRSGRTLYFANTGTLVSTRMYAGLRALWAGWSKNVFVLLGASHAATWSAVAWHLGVWALPPLTCALALARLTLGDGAWLGAAGSGVIAFALLPWLERLDVRDAGLGWRRALAAPVAHAVLALIIVNSWSWHTMRREIWWRGRSYRFAHDEVAR